VVSIAAGGSQSLALQANGMLVGWGNAQVAQGVTANKAIACGFGHNLAIRSGQVIPLITGEPTNIFCLSNGTAGFSVVVAAIGGLQYQWQFDGDNVPGATNSSFMITSVESSNEGPYDVVVSSTYGVVTSAVATLTIVRTPQIASSNPAPGPTWINYAETLSVAVNAAGQPEFPLNYSWQLNGTNIAGASSSSYNISNLNSPNDGAYTVTITNAAGTTAFTWTEILALPGMIEAWGSDNSGESTRPANLTNATSIATGEYQSVAVTDSGTVVQWGQYSDGTNLFSVIDTNHVTLPPASGVVAVAAGLGQALALTSDGTITTWGLKGASGTVYPTNLTNVKAIACGWQFDVALLNNGTVVAWSSNNPALNPAMTNVPSNLTNVIAIAAGPMHTLALQANGTVVAWGCGTNGETNVPASLANVVAIAAGRYHSLALSNNGTIAAWGAGTSNNPSDGINYGQSIVPAGLSNVMALAAGDFHSVALKNDGTLVEWGDNSNGQATVPAEQTNIVVTTSGTMTPTYQTNIYPPIVVKLIAAAGDHTMAAIFSPLVQYPVDVSKDLLLIYNTNSIDSSNVCQYYLTHRPMVSNANVLGIGVTTSDPIYPPDFTNIFLLQVQMWLTNNPTKRPLYVILFQNLPQEVDPNTNTEDTAFPTLGSPSVQYQLHYWTAPAWSPFITAINMNGRSGTNFNSSDGTNDCIAYINKLALFWSNYGAGQLIISASAGLYGNNNWYFDDSYHGETLGYNAENGVLNANPSASIIYSNTACITYCTNIAGYFNWGYNGAPGAGYATNGVLQFSGNSDWYIIETDESFNGQRVSFQGNFLQWYSSNAFGGSNYSNTPVGAVTQVEEPGSAVNDPYAYFGLWASGKTFACCAWNSFAGYGAPFIQAVGDPFTKR
jgi:alpha-tubulin suppressor-like RCC1 family protein